MTARSKPLVLVACLSLLSLQLGGVHVHADDSGSLGVPETPFSHSHGHHGHHDAHHSDDGGAGPIGERENTKDVSLLELALSQLKMPLAILALVLLFALLPSLKTHVNFYFAYRVLSGRHTRWRPPLRAPPQAA